MALAAPTSSSSLPEGDAEPEPSLSPRPRKPPGPWTHEETLALIDVYQEKWFSLKRGQLKASHWDEVAELVCLRCGYSSPSKTATQCRHKVEKLRKRYRTERQKNPDYSSWPYFRKMEFMESPGLPKKNPNPRASPSPSPNSSIPNGIPLQKVRFVSDTGPRPLTFNAVKLNREDAERSYLPSPPPHPRSQRSCPSSRAGVKHARDPISELTSVVKCIGEGFMKLEHMKMEMMRDMERMRMEMEMKRMEMVLESQQHVAELFARALYSTKKFRRDPSSES
ncbi:hypothetical protein AMTRI_Chr03g52210 [Amborella trichopoda]|uniref:Myb-like domain-containing protein n=1 Tax=Amborella trichopoda TaxID=13333 RepID=W1P0H6_AMBTC|nr:trihelix transcription factor ASIL1 [Amborella trichopoda]ERN01061.1 hypothetical protein AMTR_s00002p00164190 [Amborella trichopoda]|eukprot:XP_006838492.1 trihelix transcription factor ASIL1 [Amborella trichopoda]